MTSGAVTIGVPVGAAGPRPTAALASVRRYAVPRPACPMDLYLDGNEGAVPPDALVDALRSAMPGAVRSYPSAADLERAFAARLHVAPERVLVTAGADDAIDRLCRALVGDGREVILPEPTFEMIARYARIAGGTIVPVPWRGAWPVEGVIGAVTERTALVVAVSPNNPTGAAVPLADVARVAAAAPHAVVLLDHAYVEFADGDPTAEALRLPNVVVTRTLSKAWGLAGLRVGYVAGPAEVIGWLRTAGAPYAVAGPSLLLAAARLADGDADVAAFVGRVRGERERLEALLAGLGAEVAPSQANFVFARVRDALWLRDALAGLGISVRMFPGREDLAGAVRITCPGGPVERVEAALRAALRPDALLFDMDGVLVDVSGSYRAAIVETAASFGVAVTAADIAGAKAAGDANNDWILTQRLLAARGVQAELGEVTRRFEVLYQGTDAAPGLRRHERLTVDRAWLERLAARLPLGIVTGRPRGDAERLLAEQGIADLFGAVVCMHDAPRKPDPAPVRLALERLGVSGGWLVGDTPDDVRAARAAGVVPVGIAAPGEDATQAGAALVAAGAGRVLTRLTELEDLLP